MTIPIRRFFKPILSLLLFFAIIGGLIYLALSPRNGIHVASLEADLVDKLPDGSSWEQARSWFASHSFELQEIHELDGRKIGLMTTVPNDSWIHRAEIRINLYFDDQGRLNERIIYRFEFWP